MPASPAENLQRDREKQGVAKSSLLAAVGLTAIKLLVGVLTNSLGILAEAAHSALDLAAAAMTWWAVRVSSQPADRQHTYGHGKVESLSALVETQLLLVTCVWIVYESVRRLWFGENTKVLVTGWSFLVVIVSIVVDISRSRALSRAAKKHGSQALEADALHFSTDIWSSLVVLLGLCGVAAAERFSLPWLEKADAAAALGVAVIVIWISYRLGKRSVDALLDAVPRGLQEQLADAAAGVSGVEAVKKVRLRWSGADAFADVTLAVDHATPFEKTHDIANQAEAAVRAVLPRADVVVHIEPVAAAHEDLPTTIRVLAARLGLGAHGIRTYQGAFGGRIVELHLEVSQSHSLQTAHQQATAFEDELHKTVPDVSRIVTHLEPAGGSSALLPSGRDGIELRGRLQVCAAIDEFLARSPLDIKPHDVEVQSAGGELHVSFHFALDASLPITAAHELTEQLEAHLRAGAGPGPRSDPRRAGRSVVGVGPAVPAFVRRPRCLSAGTAGPTA